MGCVKPLDAYWKNRSRDGITFDINKSLTRISFRLPCGRCIGCRMEKARQWGIRCVHEAKLWRENSYVTLTYDDEYMPDGGSLSLRDVQLFMKRLRKKLDRPKGNGVRFFLGAEYGEINKRPHYHALLFNCGFEDKVLHSYNKRGEPLYTSKVLSELWFQGFSTIGDVTFKSAVYCAKYALKKVTGDPAYEHYQIMDEYGIIHDRSPEFAIMSRRPGIGSGYYDRFGTEVRDHDSVVIDGKEVRVPRFYDVRTRKANEERYEVLKAKRKLEAVKNKSDNTVERLDVKERIMLANVKSQERKL